MQLGKGNLYHIYNQGNNKRKIFFNRNNYLFFLKKVNTYITPYADIIAWCLMPNHFHFMVLINEIELPVTSNTVTATLKDSISRKNRSINDSIGIMLRSYTRAINKQQNFSGKLFREKTKAECISCHKGITPSYIMQNGVTKINFKHPDQQYPQVCFNYIHDNPVKAKLVIKATDWEFSSAMDFANLRDGKLVNKKVADEYVRFNL